jgi:hypothetical protein
MDTEEDVQVVLSDLNRGDCLAAVAYSVKLPPKIKDKWTYGNTLEWFTNDPGSINLL